MEGCNVPERRSRDGKRPPRSPSSGVISNTVSGSAGSDGALVGLNHRQEQVPDENYILPLSTNH